MNHDNLNPTDSDDLWSRCYQILQANVPPPAWMTSLRFLHILEINDNKVVLAVPNNTTRARILSRHNQVLQAALAEVGIEDAEVEIELRDDLPPPAEDNVVTQPDLTDAFDNAAEQERRLLQEAAHNHPAAHLAAHATAGTSPAPAGTSPAPAAAGTAPSNPGLGNIRPGKFLDDQYTFDNFVVASSNRFAYATALAVAEDPANNYNPLFLYANAGLGKTHLLRAIAHFLRTHHPDVKTRYVTTETFLNEFVDGITNRHQEFKKHYRNVDVLLLDDIQIIEGKEAFQEELFHTFNDLHANRHQIVISSDRPPSKLATLSDRMRSRFSWGLSVDIQAPAFETRLAILRSKCNGVQIDDGVLSLVAEKITDNVRELEGALTRIIAYGRLNNAPVSMEMAHALLGELLSEEARKITPKLIIEAAVEQFGVETEKLRGPARQKELVYARHITMYVMRELTDMSYPAIADYFNGRDHSSVMHAFKKIDEGIHEDKDLYRAVTELINTVKAP